MNTSGENLTSGEKLIQKDIEQEMKDAYLDYSMSVIASRALPDVRDGLKPVHRRILYTMYGNGLYPERATRTAMPRSMTRWCAWRRTFHCAIRWCTATATSVRSTATRRRLTDTPRPR